MHTDHVRRALAGARDAELDRAARSALLTAPVPPALRPVAPSDHAPLGDFFAGLSPASRHRRFLGPVARLSGRDLARFTDVDHRADDGLLAVGANGRLLGFAQYAAWGAQPGVAEFAIAVADDWQGRGLGLRLGRELVARARAHERATLTATTLADNVPAQRLLRRLGFERRGRVGREVELALAL